MASVFYRRAINRVKYRFGRIRWGGFFFGLAFFVLVGYIGYVYFFMFSPALLELGEAHANRIGQEVIHKAIEEVIENNEYLTASLVTVQTSDDGNLTAVLPNVITMNQLKSRLTLGITEKIRQADETVISIPAGAMLGVDALAGYGPRFQIKMIPYGKVYVDLESHFSDAGINQTCHRILAKAQVDISLLMSDSREVDSRICVTVPLSETLVVGSVPNSYTNLETQQETVKDDLLNLVE